MSKDKIYNQLDKSFNQKDEMCEEKEKSYKKESCKKEESACGNMRRRLSRKSPVDCNSNCSSKLSKRTSGRKVKRRKLDPSSSSHSNKLHHRECERVGCAGTIPICFASATERCAGSGYTSRWYHMSSGEHYCNECFEYFYRSYKAGYSTLIAWKKKWSQNAKFEPTLKAFMADQLLPYWVKCVIPGCGKWRQLPKDTELTAELIANFCCSMANSKDKKIIDYCSVPEDSRIADVLQPIWIAYLTQPGLLRNSPSAVYLQQYYYDGVGLSPTSSCTAKTWDRNPYLQPFYQPTEPGRARCFRPDVMELDEVKEFPEYSREQAMYLGIRNLIIAMWNLCPEEWLTIEKVAQHLVCRGLARIRCLREAERILKYFTKKGIVNFGIVTSPCGFKLVPTLPGEKVIVIGAGISGVGTARHLQNLGIQVTLLEARDRIGGRIWDDNSLGTVVGKGAHIVTGVINNPITVMADQAGIAMRFINDKCDLYDDSGSPTSLSDDQRVEFHFNAILDAIAEWRKGKMQDISLYDKMEEMHKSFSNETTSSFTKTEENLLQFHISNLEYACGSHLRDVSCLYWDQNDIYPQFAGDHTILPCGYSALLGMATQQLKISFKEIVKKIDYTGDKVVVTTTDETVHEASRVVVTVPLAILQKGFIEFVPPLPQNKLWALNNLGAGIIEKVVLQFPTRFWDSKLQDADFFGLIPSSSEKRGLFAVFYDLAPQNRNQNGNCHVLMTYVSGDMVSFISEKKERDIINMCMKVLKSIFSDEETVVPDPTAWIVTKWKDDPFASMAYSYIRTGGNGDAYDFLADDIEQKIYFAGEATNRRFPQTVTGAYLSGLREASKIIDHISQCSSIVS